MSRRVRAWGWKRPQPSMGSAHEAELRREEDGVGEVGPCGEVRLVAEERDGGGEIGSARLASVGGAAGVADGGVARGTPGKVRK
ncbi:MAG: hypothetical protein ACK56F_30185, partial [bacterium]